MTATQNWKRLTTTCWSNQSSALVIMWPEVWCRSGHRSRKDSWSSCQRVRTVCFETGRLEEAVLTDSYMCAQVLLLKEQTRRSCWLIWRRSWSRADSWSEHSRSHCRSGTRAVLTSDLLFRTVAGSDLSLSLRTVWPRPSPLRWWTATIWRSGSGCRTTGRSLTGRGGASSKRGRPSLKLLSDWVTRWDKRMLRVHVYLSWSSFLHVFLRFLMPHEVSSPHWGPGPARGPRHTSKGAANSLSYLK